MVNYKILVWTTFWTFQLLQWPLIYFRDCWCVTSTEIAHVLDTNINHIHGTSEQLSNLHDYSLYFTLESRFEQLEGTSHLTTLLLRLQFSENISRELTQFHSTFVWIQYLSPYLSGILFCTTIENILTKINREIHSNINWL